jgi:CheY-like chemotaxis protein/anti-sigma regulatory factor (Ser/Thr protein kinase)
LDERDRAPVPGAAEALHDVSNALTVLLGWLEEAARADVSPEDRERAIAVATRKAREARSLAREAIGATPSRDVARKLGDIVTDVLDGLSIEAARAGVSLIASGDGDADVQGASAIGHVVTNLVLNALSFSPAGSTIRVSLEHSTVRAKVTIADEGPGVDKAIASMLFEGRTSRPGGAGIGLRHAREIVRRLGGDLLHVDVGTGATFEVTLPRHVARFAPSDAPRSSASSQSMRSMVSGARVLVLEDDRAVCALLDAGLGARGVEVIALHDEASLRAALSRPGSIDAVLLDLSPIAHDVEGSFSAVRAAHPNAGVVVISGSAVAVESELVNTDKRTRWVRKPFEVSEITQAIAELLPPREG